jgi:RNA polymerase sigma-70 factor (ECF subfamily)
VVPTSPGREDAAGAGAGKRSEETKAGGDIERPHGAQPDPEGRPIHPEAGRVIDVGRGGREHVGDTKQREGWIAPVARAAKSQGRRRPYTQVMGELRVAEGELSDEALLAGMAVGDQAAAVAFVRRYQRRVFGLAYSMTNDAGVAEDVAQEAMIRVWKHAPVFDPRRGSVASWVLTITRNLAIDALRLRRAVPTDPDDFAASAMRSNEHNPEDSVRRGEVRQTVRDALEVLPPEQRRAVVLASVYGRTALEISESENIPLGTAKTRIRTALIRLRAAIEHSEGVNDDR